METAVIEPLLRVLFVDNCHDTINSMRTLCKLLGFDALGVKNGLAALEATRAFSPNIIVMDISMPNMDGYEAARRIREREDGRDIVLVAMTGWGGEELEQKARDAGFDHYWLKPVNFDVMRSLFTSVQKDLLLTRA